jgi:hypothetical protein
VHRRHCADCSNTPRWPTFPADIKGAAAAGSAPCRQHQPVFLHQHFSESPRRTQRRSRRGLPRPTQVACLLGCHQRAAKTSVSPGARRQHPPTFPPPA